MAQPIQKIIGSTANNTFPVSGADEIPLGVDINLGFSVPVDLHSLKEAIAIYGPDFDRTSGPNNAVWVNQHSGENPFFFRSPGFGGFVDFDVTGLHWDLATDTYTEQDQLAAGLFEQPAAIDGFVARLTPKKQLGKETEYTLYAFGQTDEGNNAESNLIKAISKRTVYDPYTEAANVKTKVDGLTVRGMYTGDANDILNIKFLTDGAIGTAKYKWWWGGEVEPGNNDLNRQLRASHRYRNISDDLTVRFTSGEYAVDQHIKVNCYTPEYLQTSFTFKFKTGTGSILELPIQTSSSPIGVFPRNFPEENIQAPVEPLKILSIEPNNRGTNIPLCTEKITITFNRNIKSNSVDQSKIKIFSHPVSGFFDGSVGTRNDREYKVYKEIEVVDNKIILTI